MTEKVFFLPGCNNSKIVWFLNSKLHFNFQSLRNKYTMFESRRREKYEIQIFKVAYVKSVTYQLTLSSVYTHFNLSEKKKKKTLRNIVEKSEIAQNEQFHLFPQCLLCNLYVKSFNMQIFIVVCSFFEFGTISKCCIRDWVNCPLYALYYGSVLVVPSPPTRLKVVVSGPWVASGHQWFNSDQKWFQRSLVVASII